MKKIIHSSRVITYVSCLASAAGASILGLVGPVADNSDFLSYYTSLIFGPLGETFFITVILSLVAILTYIGFFLILNAFYHKRDPWEFLSRPALITFFKSIGRGFLEILLIGGPVILTLVFISLTMSYINPVSATRLVDTQVLEWDRLLTGGYPFITLHALSYPDWFIRAVEFSFMNLPIILVAVAFYIFFFRRALFEEMGAVFSLSLIIMIFFWQLIPVLSPHDRFIDNVYNLPIPSKIEKALESHHPQALIQDFLDRMREHKNRNLHGTMPTSTLPSAHTGWAVLLVYYCYKARKELLLVIFPVALFSTIGTFLFAQHYFVDIPAGALVMILSIYLVQLAARNKGTFSRNAQT